MGKTYSASTTEITLLVENGTTQHNCNFPHAKTVSSAYLRWREPARTGSAGLEPVLTPPLYAVLPELGHASPSGRNGI